jgi:hypothetical protein
MNEDCPPSDPAPLLHATEVKRHPLFGALKGATHIPSGVDLTEPADPDWGKVYEE